LTPNFCKGDAGTVSLAARDNGAILAVMLLACHLKKYKKTSKLRSETLASLI